MTGLIQALFYPLLQLRIFVECLIGSGGLLYLVIFQGSPMAKVIENMVSSASNADEVDQMKLTIWWAPHWWDELDRRWEQREKLAGFRGE